MPCLNCKTCSRRLRRKPTVAVGILLLYLSFSLSLSQFQSVFESFLHVSAVLCRCLKAMSTSNRASVLRDLSTHSH